jgi:hypothetical protein
LNKSATKIPSECKIASIDPDDAMILPHDANPGRIEFSETTGLATAQIKRVQTRVHITDAGRRALRGKQTQ